MCQANRYLTRNAGSVVPVFQKLSMTQKSLHFMGPKVWNSLPDEPRSIPTFGIFHCPGGSGWIVGVRLGYLGNYSYSASVVATPRGMFGPEVFVSRMTHFVMTFLISHTHSSKYL